MNKDKFLQVIKDGLNDFPSQELEDIIYDYEEHFYSAMQAGKSEEEITSALGDPYVIVNGYRAGYMQKVQDEKGEQKNTGENFKERRYDDNSQQNSKVNTNKILKFVIIGLLLLFLGPVAIGIVGALVGVIITIIVLPFSLTIAGVVILFSTMFNQTLGVAVVPTFIADLPTAVVGLMTIGSFAFSLLSLMIAYYAVKWCVVSIREAITKRNNRGIA